MQFNGLEPLRDGFPTTQLVTVEHKFDLHNDADLREIVVDFLTGELRLAWTVKPPAWNDPSRSEAQQRKTAAGFILSFSGVRTVAMAGSFLSTNHDDDRTIDFLEYSRVGNGLGRMRIVLENESEVEIVASRCNLVLVELR